MSDCKNMTERKWSDIVPEEFWYYGQEERESMSRRELELCEIAEYQRYYNIKQDDSLREILLDFCTMDENDPTRDEYEYGFVPISSNGNEVLSRIMRLYGVEEGDGEYRLWPYSEEW